MKKLEKNSEFSTLFPVPQILHPFFGRLWPQTNKNGGHVPESPWPGGFRTVFTSPKAHQRPKICPKHGDPGPKPDFNISRCSMWLKWPKLCVQGCAMIGVLRIFLLNTTIWTHRVFCAEFQGLSEYIYKLGLSRCVVRGPPKVFRQDASSFAPHTRRLHNTYCFCATTLYTNILCLREMQISFFNFGCTRLPEKSRLGKQQCRSTRLDQ